MGTLSNYAESKLLRHVFLIAPYLKPATITIGLSKTVPNDAGNITEPSGGGYSRVIASNWSSASNRQIYNTSIIEFPNPSLEWGTIYGIFATDQASNLLWYGILNTPKAVNVGNVLTFPIGEIIMSFNSGGLSTYLANKLLDHIFAKSTYIQPSGLYLALSTSSITDSSSVPVEPAGGNYSRVSVGAMSESEGIVTNNSDITFPSATSNWGAIEAICICDDADGGNILFYKAMSDLIVQEGDTLTIPSGELRVSLD